MSKLKCCNHVLQRGNEYVTSPYGWRTHPVTGKKDSFHYGIDLIDSSYGTDKVCAFASGTVIDIRNSVSGFSTIYSAGNYIVIKHNSKYQTVYYHLKQNTLKVKIGSKVKAGQVIATMGTTGSSTGNHLHFGIQRNGAFINPKPFLLGTSTMFTIYSKGNYKTTTNMFLRKGPGTTYQKKKVKEMTTQGKKFATSKNPNASAKYRKGTIFTVKKLYYKGSGAVWAECPSGYICLKGYNSKGKVINYCSKV